MKRMCCSIMLALGFVQAFSQTTLPQADPAPTPAFAASGTWRDEPARREQCWKVLPSTRRISGGSLLNCGDCTIRAVKIRA